MYITKEPILGNSKSKFILIKDSTGESGIKLLKAVINAFLKENVKLHIIYYELMGLDLLSNYDIRKNQVSKVDAASDPFGWNDSSKASQNFRDLNALTEFCSAFKGVICVDSLSPLLIHNDVNIIYKTLHQILKDNNDLQLIAVMHTDVHDTLENEIMERLATTILNVMPYEDKFLSTIKYSSGKVTNQIVEYEISKSFEFSMLRDFNPQIKSTVKQPDPTANLTFNLRLKDNEIEARNQVPLPYLHVQGKEDINESDMYDEEDPDDDLDI